MPSLVAPRVSAAVLRTLFNGWVTERRFQRWGPCRFGCREAEDSIEHYACCPVVLKFGKGFLQLVDVLESPKERVARFVSLGSWFGRVSDADLTRRAILVFAVYRSFLLHKHMPDCTVRAAGEALPQFAREAVRNHARSRRHVCRWVHPATSQRPARGEPLDDEAEDADTEEAEDM